MGRQIRKPADLGEKALQFALKGLISWVFTPVLGERGVMVKGGCPFFFRV